MGVVKKNDSVLIDTSLMLTCPFKTRTIPSLTVFPMSWVGYE